MPTPQQSARAIRLASARQRFADDASMRSVLFAIETAQQSRADIETKRAHLEASGHFTAAGIFEKLKDYRVAHAKSLEPLLKRLEANAKTLAASLQPKFELPQDHARILDHFNGAAPAEREQLLNAAMGGKDDELARVLIHPSSRRYVDVQPQVLAHMERRYVDAAAVTAATPKLQAYQLAHETLTETIAELSAEAN